MDGKKTAQAISNRLKEEISKYLSQGKRAPKIDIILVGEEYASKMYVDMKSKKALDLGIQVNVHTYQNDISQEELESVIKELN